MEHIEDWAKVKDHEFDNMIVLCATCHARVTTGEIAKSAIRRYKQNLAIVNARYSLFEMRLLQVFFESERIHEPGLNAKINSTDFLHVKGLIDDGLIIFKSGGAGMTVGGHFIGAATVFLTDAGRAFTAHYFKGEVVGQ